MKRNKKAFAVVLTLTLMLASTTGTGFAEVDYSQWDSQSTYPADVVNTQLFTPVKFLIDKKIITGYPDGSFKPENPITRAEIAVAITKLTNRTNNVAAMESINKFKDLSGYGGAKGYINTLADANIIKGTSQTTFSPGENISYAELITMLIRTKSGASYEVENMGNWPDNYIQYANMYNMLGDVVIKDWSASASRGDMAKLMYRITPKSTSTSAISINQYAFLGE